MYERCESPAIDTFLAKAMRQLSKPEDRFKHRVIVLNDPTENAISIPGGTIYLFRGLLDSSRGPGEILGVLSHEISHAEERHSVRQVLQSPNGIITNGNAMWNQAEKDHEFFDDMLSLFKEKLCVDTARVFSCGFSYGAMFTNSLSLNHQKQLRAVACYAPANWNIYMPENIHEPIAYMSVTGNSDPNCPFIYNDANKQGGKYCVLTHAQDNDCTIPASIPTENPGSRKHSVYEFEGCKEGYPVKFFSFDGAHQAGPMDGVSGDNSSKSWVPGETWKFFMQF